MNRSVSRSSVVGAIFAAVSLVQVAHRYLEITIGTRNPIVDASEVWVPLASRVLSGAPLYVRPAVDNKPPLWQFVNIGWEITGHYYAAALLTIGLFNAAAAWLIYRLLSDSGREGQGAVAGLLFLSVLPMLHGTHVNVRSLAVVFLLLAFRYKSAVFQGVMVACAALISQYGVLVLPALLLDWFESDTETYSSISRITVGGFATVAAVFGAVGVIWGPIPMENAVYWSFGIAGEYAAESQASPFVNPYLWAQYVSDELIGLVHFYIPAGIGLALVSTPLSKSNSQRPIALAAVLLSLPLLLRGYGYYWIYPAPFLSILAAKTYARVLR